MKKKKGRKRGEGVERAVRITYTSLSTRHAIGVPTGAVQQRAIPLAKIEPAGSQLALGLGCRQTCGAIP